MSRYDPSAFEWSAIQLCFRTSREGCRASMIGGCGTACSGVPHSGAP
jgi:hypothetical protein